MKYRGLPTLAVQMAYEQRTGCFTIHGESWITRFQLQARIGTKYKLSSLPLCSFKLCHCSIMHIMMVKYWVNSNAPLWCTINCINDSSKEICIWAWLCVPPWGFLFPSFMCRGLVGNLVPCSWGLAAQRQEVQFSAVRLNLVLHMHTKDHPFPGPLAYWQKFRP